MDLKFNSRERYGCEVTQRDLRKKLNLPIHHASVSN